MFAVIDIEVIKTVASFLIFWLCTFVCIIAFFMVVEIDNTFSVLISLSDGIFDITFGG